MALYRDSVGNIYTKLPTKKPVSSAKAATNTSMRRSRNQGHRKPGAAKHKHGIETGRNRQPWLTRRFNRLVRECRRGV